MNIDTETRLEKYIEIADIHAERLKFAFSEISSLHFKTVKDFENLTQAQVRDIDGALMRFIKLQDVIGSDILPRILEITENTVPTQMTFIDKLNKLEKLEYLSDAKWWQKVRNVRNDITHDYPTEAELMIKYFNDFKEQTVLLLEYWNDLRIKLTRLLS